MNDKELKQFRHRLEELKADAPEIMEKLVVEEGVYCVKQARDIVAKEKKVDTGEYRWSFRCGNKSRVAGKGKKEYDGAKPRVKGSTYTVDVYNNLDYASYIETGFRSHFVPAKYLRPSLLAQVRDKQAAGAAAKGGKPPDKLPQGIYIGPYRGVVSGIWTLHRAMRNTKAVQKQRLQRKMKEEISKRLGGKK